MKNSEAWKPSKFIYNKKGKLVASKNLKVVRAGSRLMANLIAQFYDVALKKYAKGKLIDLGCGNVPLYRAYKKYITSNICVDWPHTEHKNKFLDYECDLTQNLPFEDNEFDTIVLSDVLEHIPNPDNLWKEMNRILRLNGIIILNVPFFYWLHERPFDYYRYTKFQLEKFCNDYNFDIIKLGTLGGSLEVLTDIIAKHLSFIPLVGVPFSIIIQFIVLVLRKIKLVKKISEKTSLVYPYGYVLIAKKK
jgi:SAM-dependent methyltransferase